MNLFVISDTHGDHRKVKIPECDVLIHCGDFSLDDSIGPTLDFLRWFDAQPAYHKIFIAGNHDRIAETDPAFFSKAVAGFAPNCYYLQDSGCMIKGLRFWGSPVTPRFYNWAFNRDRGEDIKRHWDMIPGSTDVLITHGPPQEILDLSNNWNEATGKKFDDHLGCQDLHQAVIRIKPKLHCFGHIHGSGGKLVEIGGCKFVNASLMDESYSLVQRGVSLQIS